MNKMPSAKEALSEMNGERVVVQIKGKVRIAGWEWQEVEPGFPTRIVAFSTPSELKTLYANRFINVKTTDAQGNTHTKRRPLFDYWLESADRPTATGVTMDPNGERIVNGQLNLWQGFGVVPKPGDWERLAYHIVMVICGGNTKHADYLLKHIAWMLQNPTKPTEVVVVMRGRKGTGKGMLARLLRQIFGAHGLQISDRKHLVGSFNAHLMQLCFLFADEAIWPGDKSAEGVLKRLVTEPTLLVEPKGIDAFEVPNRLSIFMASNEQWVVPASTDERRFVVFDVSDRRKQDFQYFSNLLADLDAGGREAFLHDMLAMDLKGWHPRQDIPQTQGLADQQAESAPPMVQWLGSLLEEGVLPEYVRDAGGALVRVVHGVDPSLARAGPLWDHVRHQYPALRHQSQMAFWKFLDEHGIVKAEDKRSAAGRFRRFPPLAEARRVFREKYPWWQPFEDDQTDWRHPVDFADVEDDIAGFIQRDRSAR